jgi:hypothetical protein
MFGWNAIFFVLFCQSMNLPVALRSLVWGVYWILGCTAQSYFQNKGCHAKNVPPIKPPILPSFITLLWRQPNAMTVDEVSTHPSSQDMTKELPWPLNTLEDGLRPSCATPKYA